MNSKYKIVSFPDLGLPSNSVAEWQLENLVNSYSSYFLSSSHKNVHCGNIGVLFFFKFIVNLLLDFLIYTHALPILVAGSISISAS